MKDKKDELMTLLIRLQNSNYQAFSDLFKIYSQQVYFFCCKSLSKEDAEEIMQNVFMTVWENRQKIDLQYSFSAYLFSIAKHQVYNAIRSKIAQKTFEEKYLRQTEEVEIPQEYDDTVEKLHEKLKQGIRSLPDRQREIFMMSRTYRMTYKEIAEKLGISENTVDTSIRRSLEVLRRLVQRVVIIFFLIH
ncbi:MAG: RNA polymerase sigma-70 factor [Bacteroidales bacterium]|jgi:RNA polymerase sigma-70 factor (ECF subfamily)|nr:RNA polymerase sigma-70 factor [Bacteroidales bacterium]